MLLLLLCIAAVLLLLLICIAAIAAATAIAAIAAAAVVHQVLQHLHHQTHAEKTATRALDIIISHICRECKEQNNKIARNKPLQEPILEQGSTLLGLRACTRSIMRGAAMNISVKEVLLTS